MRRPSGRLKTTGHAGGHRQGPSSILKAGIIAFLTAVEKACVNFNTLLEQEEIYEIDTARAEKHIDRSSSLLAP